MLPTYEEVGNFTNILDIKLNLLKVIDQSHLSQIANNMDKARSEEFYRGSNVLFAISSFKCKELNASLFR